MPTNSNPKKLLKSTKQKLQDQLADIGEQFVAYNMRDMVRRINEILEALEDA
jgi:hypothetical protein